MIALDAKTGKVLWRTRTIPRPGEPGSMQLSAIAEKPSLDSLYAIRTSAQIAPGTDKVGAIHAISVDKGTTAWKYEQRYPIAYAVGGRQYIAVSTGTSLATGGTNRLTPEIRPSAGNTLFVFALPN